MVNKKKFIITEAGINHGGNLKKALKLVDEAKIAGANAIKFQTYKTEKRVNIDSPIFKILKKCELQFEDFKIIKKYCDKKKIDFFSNSFDKESVIFLNKLGVKLFKIASFDVSNFELIEEISKTKKPVIVSTGMATLSEIKKVYKYFIRKKIKIILLHCISSYPLKEEDSRLNNIKFLKKKFNCEVGLSDHTNDIKTSLIAYTLGVRIFEKHFRIEKDKSCVDYPVSLDKKQFLKMNQEMERIDKILGSIKFGVRNNEKNTKQFKRKKII